MSTQRQLSDGEHIVGTPYRVIRLIGLGGMGCVYEVEHEELGKRFMLKALLRELASRADLVQRMRTEWRALGRLEHPNIVRVSDAGLADGKLPYYVMERLRGASLAEELKRRGRLPIEEALSIACAVLDGLGAAHEIGIVHRDVKPPNIFLCTDGVPRLLDFGIAKLLDLSAESITAKGIAVGTPRYMSPEQAAGDPVDARADLYAVGLVLFEMITGTGPYKAADANEMFLAHLTQKAPPISSRARGITPELDALVASLLAKKPAERPSSAAVAAQRLRTVLAPQRASSIDEPQLRKSERGKTPDANDTGIVSQSDLLTLIGDMQQVLDAPTRHANPPLAGRQPPPLPKTPPRLETEALDRTSQHTLFLNEVPLPVSNGAVSTLTSVDATGYLTSPQVMGSKLSRAQLGRWLFPFAVVGVAVVALVLTIPRPAVEISSNQALPIMMAVTLPSPTPPAIVESPVAVEGVERAGALDAGPKPAHVQDIGPVNSAPAFKEASFLKVRIAPSKSPPPKLISRNSGVKAPVRSVASPGEDDLKASLLPPSGL